MSWLSTKLARVKVRMIEALGGTAFGSLGASGDTELDGFRRISEKTLTRDLDPMSHQQMLRVAHFLYESDPVAHGPLIDTRVDICLGGKALKYAMTFDHKRMGIEKQAAADLASEARDFLDKTWNHPTHDLGRRAREYLTTYMVQGHLVLPVVAVNAVSGALQLDFVDAAMIDSVKPLASDSGVPSSLQWEAVLVKRDQGQPVPFNVVRFDTQTERMLGPGAPAAGDAQQPWCFYFRNSRLLNASRGRSELMQLADWIDGYNQFMWSRLDHSTSANAAIWDVTLKGGTDINTNTRAKEIKANPPTKPGTVIVHNDMETWEAKTPDLKAADASAEVKTFQTYILGAKGIPESWMSSGSGTNKATAGEQNDITLRGLEALQETAVEILRSPLLLAYDNLAERQHKFPRRATGAVTIEIDLPPLNERDSTRASAALSQLEAALDGAVTGERISLETSRRVFCSALQHTGVQVDPEEEAAKIETERADREARQQEQANLAARAAIDDALPADEGDEDEPPTPPADKTEKAKA